MELIERIDKKLNGNHYLMNIIFSYLGKSPSAKVMASFLNDEDIKEYFDDRIGMTFCYKKGVIYKLNSPNRGSNSKPIFKTIGLDFSINFFHIYNKYMNEAFENEKKHIRNFKTPTIMDVKRCKVDVMKIDDEECDCDGEYCYKTLNYWEREHYGNLCENCYGRMMRWNSDSEDEEDEEIEEDY